MKKPTKMTPSDGLRPAVFLDRDGTINEDVGYPGRIEQVRIYPAAFEAVRRLRAAGFAVVVVTNQSGVGRGYFSEDDVRRIHAWMAGEFAAAGAPLDGIYYCPHFAGSPLPAYDVDCDCRKPRPRMGRAAASELRLDLGRSYMVGDKVDDLLFGANLGAAPVLVRTGYGERSIAAMKARGVEAAFVAADVLDAAEWILRRRGDASSGDVSRGDASP